MSDRNTRRDSYRNAERDGDARSRYSRSRYEMGSEERAGGRSRTTFSEAVYGDGSPSHAESADNSERRRKVNLWEMAGESRSRYSSRYVGLKEVADQGGDEADERAQAAGAAKKPAEGFDRYSRRSYEGRSGAQAASGAHASGSAAEQRASAPSSGADAAAPKRRGRKAAHVVAGVIAALVLIGAGVAAAYLGSIASNLQRGVDQDLRDALVATDMGREPFYLLLMGTDGSAERDAAGDMGGVYRSDSMMLARVDVPAKKVTLVSINRDIAVELGEYGEQKLNAAYGLGGPALAVEAVSRLLGVDISHYAQVDFDAFSSLVDALGGVEVDVPIEIDDWTAGGYVEAGLHTLSGQEALILCRSRNAYSGSAHPDEMRAANQRLVISAIAKKLLASDIATIAASVSSVSNYVTTDLGLSDIIGLAQLMRGLDPSSDIYTAMVPTTSQYLDDTWYEFLNQKAWGEMRARIDKGLPPTEGAVVDEATGTVLATAGADATEASAKYAMVTVKNGTNRPGLAAAARTSLMNAGFVNVVIGDVSEGYAYPETLVIYEHAEQAHEAEQIVDVLGQGEVFLNDGNYLVYDADFVVVIGEDWRS